MANLTGEERSVYVQSMFTRIAPHYDLMNRLMTAGQDIRWRQEVIRRARLETSATVLDLGAGTGDLSIEALRQHPDCRPVPADFTLPMMHAGRARPNRSSLDWSAANALLLPFPAATFDAAVSAFLMRNVVDVPRVLREQLRVLKPGGRIVILDTTRPPENIFAPMLHLHLDVIIPALGRLVAGQPDAYEYLPESTSSFLSAEVLAAFMAEAGFREVAFRRRMLGSIAIHWGIK